MARRSDHTKEELKSLIIKASWDIIGNQGLGALTARRLAKDIGYTPGTIYNLFGSMEGVYFALNSITLDKLYNALEGGPYTKKPKDNIKMMASLYKKFAADYKPYWLMLFTYEISDTVEIPAWYFDKISRLFGPLENLLHPLYSHQSEKELQLAARVLWSSFHGMCFLEQTRKIPLINNQSPPPDMADYLIDRFLSNAVPDKR